MKWLVLVYLLLLAGCAGQPETGETTGPIVLNSQTSPDGLHFSFSQFEHFGSASGGFVLKSDGTVLSGGKRIARSKKLWAQVVALFEKYEGVDEERETDFCLSHYTEVNLVVKVGGKVVRLYYGECESSSDKAGREILGLFIEFLESKGLRSG
ncbi:hypothetical protein [Kordiimonas lacus]|uniref:Uncharacterized protein n=1 Tax=Kordiimonas lacus TaxID=637679 RepID=A0A1G6T7T8_9PROT|nr:hypothetical protein [Kordiimonas lacus]SDD25160.1 hypothetical protein SAMN04488071_0149 [Kordiimonas lacus]